MAFYGLPTQPLQNGAAPAAVHMRHAPTAPGHLPAVQTLAPAQALSATTTLSLSHFAVRFDAAGLARFEIPQQGGLTGESFGPVLPVVHRTYPLPLASTGITLQLVLSQSHLYPAPLDLQTVTPLVLSYGPLSGTFTYTNPYPASPLVSGLYTRSGAVNLAGIGDGGGLSMYESDDIVVSGNTLYGNAAPAGSGGGLRVSMGCTGIRLVNNVIVQNQAPYGSGVLVYNSGGAPVEVTMLHDTIADNAAPDAAAHPTSCPGRIEGAWLVAGPAASAGLAELSVMTIVQPSAAAAQGEGVRVYGAIMLNGRNTIVSGHAAGVVDVQPDDSDITLDYTLWHANASDCAASAICTNDRYGDPAYVNPAAWDYHIGDTSAARDQGVDAGVSVDIDGQARPRGAGYDIGADER